MFGMAEREREKGESLKHPQILWRWAASVFPWEGRTAVRTLRPSLFLAEKGSQPAWHCSTGPGPTFLPQGVNFQVCSHPLAKQPGNRTLGEGHPETITQGQQIVGRYRKAPREHSSAESGWGRAGREHRSRYTCCAVSSLFHPCEQSHQEASCRVTLALEADERGGQEVHWRKRRPPGKEQCQQ